MNLFEKACTAITEYVMNHKNEEDLIKTRQEVIDICRKTYPEIDPKGRNMSPSDICYNYCNGNQMTKDFKNWPHALEKINRSTYKLLGTNYPYSGVVLWNHSDKPMDCFGNWDNGIFKET